MPLKLAVVLFNLGGPDAPEAVAPFLRNLFSDPAIIALPALLRLPLARLIAGRRAAVAAAIYDKIGGRSPIVAETEAQGTALERALARRGVEAKAFIAMRYWHPRAAGTAAAVKAWAPDEIVLLPLYPQFSTTTTASSLDDWSKAIAAARLVAPQRAACCYPVERGFIAALTALIHDALTKRWPDVPYRLLFSAHGLPKRTVARGDPYQWQVEQTAAAVVEALGQNGLDWRICYQSRVGPLEWIGPATDAEIRRAGADGRGVIVVPISFVSEHSETLVELDIEYRHLAERSGVPDYIRVPTVGTHAAFITGLADTVLAARPLQSLCSAAGGRICPPEFSRCACRG